MERISELSVVVVVEAASTVVVVFLFSVSSLFDLIKAHLMQSAICCECIFYPYSLVSFSFHRIVFAVFVPFWHHAFAHHFVYF